MSKTLIASAIIGALVGFAPMAAFAENPVFGNTKHKILSPTGMKKVTGLGYYADYYGNRGRTYLAYADNYAAWGDYYDSYSAERSYYGAAYNYAKAATTQFYYAWYYAGY
jgi:hypothetical protein